MTTTYIWTEQCDRATDLFGETPGAQLEAEIIHAFTADPERVVRAIDHVAQRNAAGKITSSCWAVVRAELRERVQREAVADNAGARAKAITAAETYIRHALVHIDSQTELEDELFGNRGLLRQWHDDHALRTRMLTVWADLRERCEATSATPEPPPEEERHETAEQLRKRFRDLQRTPEPALQGRGGGS